MASPKGSILITGANGGLGSAIVDQVVRSASQAPTLHGLYTVRNAQRAATVNKVLQQASAKSHTYDLVQLDLSSLSSVREVAADINRRVAEGSIPPIRVLILCAGWQEYTTQTYTDDGFDMAFQSNYLSHFLLTLLLLQSMDKANGRVIVVGSWSHDTTDKRNEMGPTGKSYSYEKYREIFRNPADIDNVAKGNWSMAVEYPGNLETGYRRYGASKLCEVMFMRELCRRMAKDPELSSVAILGVDPGAMPSGLLERGTLSIKVAQKALSLLAPVLSYLQPNGTMRTTSQSARDILRAAFDTETLGAHPNGLYLDGSRLSEIGPEAQDEVKCRRLWERSIDFVELRDGETLLADWR